MKKLILISVLSLLFFGCSNDENEPDAYGNFEADEIIISAEAKGRIMNLNINEGAKLTKGLKFGLIDTNELHLMKEELRARIESINAKTKNVLVELNVIDEKISNLEREHRRFEKMKEDGAATEKQLDDIKGRIDVLKKQKKSVKSNLSTANRGLLSEIKPVKAKLQQVEYSLERAVLKSPVNGTVLVTYAEEGEFIVPGKPVCKVADLSALELTAYMTETQLAQVKIGDSVKVKVDRGKGMQENTGVITWVSDKAEFTPKIIQTKEDRKNLVYAFQVLVENDGSLKIGMPAEVYFNK